jgi:LPS export ABC transporter protein LptC
MIISHLKFESKHKGITATILVAVMFLLFITACEKKKKDVVRVAFDPEKSYTMKGLDISTLVSDSGITRYRINTKQWLEFGKAADPFWYFPEGVYFEKFDTLFRIEASVRADTAYNFYKRGLWKLVGNVKVSSLSGEHFETSLLFWDQRSQKVYSDKFMRIQQAERVITGIGFESDQSMTQYKIFNPQGIFPVSESIQDTIKQDSTK